MKRKTPPTKTFKTSAKRFKKFHQAPLANKLDRLPKMAEKKNVDKDMTANGGNEITLAAGAATWIAPSNATLLNGLVPGSLAVNRIGRKVCWTKFSLIYTVQYQMAVANSGSPFRIKVFFDKQANATAPAMTDVLQTNDFHSPNNLNNEDRFITICDFVTEPISAQNNWSVSGKEVRKLNLETIFNTGTAGTIADIQSGSIYLSVSQNGNIITTGPELQAYTRLRFLDY